ncbi:TIGR04076 family protein [Candidatus Bathyarchaeota archaeon]|nr:TIGR04076 family protein [Candidatus Bathyarchaeota archaeon]
MKECKLIGKIIRVDGECSAGHHVGEEFDLTLYSEGTNNSFRAPNVCGFFYNALFPYLVALQFGGAFPWEENKDEFTSGCPDRQKVTIAVKRVRK